MNPKITNSIIILGAMIIDFSIVNYYTKKKMLPIKNNILFRKILRAVIVMSCTNAVSIFAGLLRPTREAILLHRCFNLVYFIAYEIAFLYLADYIFWNAGKKRTYMTSRHGGGIAACVAGMTLFLVRRYEVFVIDSANRFHFGAHYYMANIFPLLLIGVSTITFAVKRRRDMGIRNRGILVSAVILFLGVMSDRRIEEIILADFFFAISIMILYISAENPEYFRSEKFRCFNNIAFERMVNELIAGEDSFQVYGIEIRNTETIKSRRGTETFCGAMAEYARWINEQFPDAYVFYTDNDCFNVLFFREVSDKAFQSVVKDSMQHTFEAIFWVREIVVDCKSPLLKNASYITSGEKAAMDNASYRCGNLSVDEEIYRRMAHEKQLNNIIGTCIRKDTLKIFIQPYYDAQKGEILSGEILTRIIDEEFGVIMPGDFIPLAEKSGKIIEMSFVIFEKTCQFIQKAGLQERGIAFISINCSPLQFQDLFLAEKLKAIADRYKVDFSIFNFEVTESFVTNSDLMKVHIEKFKKYGAHVAMDDFGKGHSNLARLREVDFDIAKLDMSLVWSYFNHKNTFLGDLIKIFKKEGLKIVAEGVETFYMAQVLSRMGCDYLQGYYFSKPIPVEEFEAFVKAYRRDRAEEDFVITKRRDVFGGARRLGTEEESDESEEQ